MRTNATYQYLLTSIIFLFSCTQNDLEENSGKKTNISKSTVNFQEVFNDSIGYGCRGMEVYNDEVYFSGIKGTCFKITKDLQLVKFIEFNHDSLDFRDIAIVNKDQFYVINSGANKAFILAYSNGKIDTVYQAFHPNAFLDDLDIDEKGSLYCLGDPIIEDGSLFLLKSEDGKEWKRIYDFAKLEKDEFFFAASGACMDVSDDSIFLAVGGKNSYLMTLRNDLPAVVKTPSKIPGTQSSGINAIINDHGNIYAVGGDYTHTADTSITFEKFNPEKINSITGGYQSTITKEGNLIICSGRNGTFHSIDEGKNWTQFLKDEFYKVILSKGKLYCSGPKGRIKIFDIEYAGN